MMNEYNEIVEKNYKEIRLLKGSDFRYKETLVIPMKNMTGYKNLEFLEIVRVKNNVIVTVEVNFVMSDWQHPINILSFSEHLRRIMYQKYCMFSEQKNIFEENLLNIRFLLNSVLDDQIISLIFDFVYKINLTHREILATKAENEGNFKLSGLENVSSIACV